MAFFALLLKKSKLNPYKTKNNNYKLLDKYVDDISKGFKKLNKTNVENTEQIIYLVQAENKQGKNTNSNIWLWNI